MFPLVQRKASSKQFILRYAQCVNAAALETLEDRRFFSVATWTGNGGDNNWTTAANWQGDTLPAAGDDIDFPASSTGAQRFVTVSMPQTIGALEFDNTVLQGSTLTLQGDITTDATDQSAILDPIILTRNTTATVPYDLVLGGVIGDGGQGYGLTFTGGGQVNLGSYFNNAGTVALSVGTGAIAENYTGITTINEGGTLYVDGTLPSATVAQDNAGVLGNDSLGGFTGSDSEIYAYDSANGVPATLTLDNGLMLDDQSDISVAIASTDSYGQIIVTGGQIDLGGGALDDANTSNFVPTIGSTFTLIHNETGQPIQNTLGGLPEGAVTTVDHSDYQVSYIGGPDHDDLTLTAVTAPTQISLQASALSTSADANELLTATITGSDASSDMIAGTVQFYQGTTPIGGPVAVVNGLASLNTKTLLPGSDRIDAIYSGDAHFSRSDAVSDGMSIEVTVHSTVSFVRAHAVTTDGKTATLSAVGSDTAKAGEKGLTYTWTLLSEPIGAKAPALTANRSNAASTTSVHLYESGSYVYQCVATDKAGEFAVADIRLTVEQKATTLVVIPARAKVSKGHHEQFSSTLLDQFGTPMHSAYTVRYAVSNKDGQVSASGLFVGIEVGKVLLDATADGIEGSATVTIT